MDDYQEEHVILRALWFYMLVPFFIKLFINFVLFIENRIK